MTDEQISIITGWMAPMTALEARSFSDALDEVTEGVIEAICETEGHRVEDDHCGKPEHRRCWVCYKAMPHAPIALQVKVDETTASKAVLPSESLGECSNEMGEIMYGLAVLFVLGLIGVLIWSFWLFRSS